MESLWVLFLFYMEEAALVGFVGMGLLGINLNLRQFVTLGICQGLVMYLVRNIYILAKIPLGTHVFFILAGLVIILHFVTRASWGIAVVGGLLGTITVLFGELLLFTPVCNYFQLTVENVLSSTWLHIAMGYVGDWLLLLTAGYLAAFRKPLIKISPDKISPGKI